MYLNACDDFVKCMRGEHLSRMSIRAYETKRLRLAKYHPQKFTVLTDREKLAIAAQAKYRPDLCFTYEREVDGRLGRVYYFAKNESCVG